MKELDEDLFEDYDYEKKKEFGLVVVYAELKLKKKFEEWCRENNVDKNKEIKEIVKKVISGERRYFDKCAKKKFDGIVTFTLDKGMRDSFMDLCYREKIIGSKLIMCYMNDMMRENRKKEEKNE